MARFAPGVDMLFPTEPLKSVALHNDNSNTATGSGTSTNRTMTDINIGSGIRHLKANGLTVAVPLDHYAHHFLICITGDIQRQKRPHNGGRFQSIRISGF